MVVLGLIEEFLVVHVSGLVVLAELLVEVGNPAELAKHVPLLREATPVGHARALGLVLLVGIQLSLGRQGNDLLVPEGLVEVLLRMVRRQGLTLKKRWFVLLKLEGVT